MNDHTALNGAAPEPEQQQIEVHLDRLTIGDLEVLERFSKQETSATELIDFLDRIIDGDVRSLPLAEMGNIIDAVQAGVGEAKNPGN